jgi:hypothetical protein
MSNIPKMLRAEARIADEDWTGIYGISPNLAFAAADRIEKLEAALRDVIDNFFDSTRICEIARKALEGKDD